MISFVLLKPDCVERNFVGKVLGYLPFNVLAIKVTTLSDTMVQDLYRDHIAQPYYGYLKLYMQSGRVVPIVLEADPIKVREIVGATDPKKAKRGTIRRKFGSGVPQNTIHASDSAEAALRELSIFFKGHDFPYGKPI